MRAVDSVPFGTVRGRVGLYRIWEPGREGRQQPAADKLALPFNWGPGGPRRVEVITHKSNQLQFNWGMIAAMCIGFGDRDYRIRALYIEYENVADPGDPVTVPDFDRDEGIEYYQDLAFSASRDFLRVPLNINPTLGIETGFENYFTDGSTGNKLTFFAQTQGTAGYHGKAFSNAANSKVFGVALVATPTFADATQDLIFARTYYDVDDQEVKQVSSQFGVTWDVSFE